MRMTIEVTGVQGAALAEYARIPISFEVARILDVVSDQREGASFRLSERAVETPYIKDYDAIADGPTEWPVRFDTSSWGLLAARIGGACVGGAVVAHDTTGLDMLEGRSDLVILWDIRVLPDWRRQGVGGALFRAAEAWGMARACRTLKVETQNINVAACRFYARHGCVLRAVLHDVYPECPGEVQLLWYKDLIDDVSVG